MSDVRIEIGDRYEAMTDRRRLAADAFAADLRSNGLEVDLRIVGYKPGRRALSPIEWTSIFIGTNVATTLISSLTADLYTRAKRMLTRRKRSKEPGLIPGRPLGFVIYGPRGEELRRWTTEDDEESSSSGEGHATETLRATDGERSS